jgi:hypothetical protein
MRTAFLFSTLACLSTLFTSTSSFAQGSTKEGYALSWDRSITVLPDSLTNGRYKLGAYTVAIYETDASSVLDQWQNELKPVSMDISGKQPMKASGVRLPDVADSALMVMASATTDKKAKMTKLTLAFARNDSTALPADQRAEAYVRQLAVKFNKAVVQGQIATYEKLLGKSGEKVTDAQDDIAKTQKKLAKANKDLQKYKAKMSKVQAENAKAIGQIAGLEAKFAVTNDPKDLKQLTKARQRLAKGETTLAKLMESEAKAQATANKYQSNLPEQTTIQRTANEKKADLERTMDALKRKQDNIR